MNVITFSFPTLTRFGAGAMSELPKGLSALGIKQPLLVTDPGLLPTKAFQSLERNLAEGHSGRRLFSSVHPNPTQDDVEAAAKAYREGGCDGVVGFGGGSALDVAKALRLLVKRPELPLSRFDYSLDWSGLPPLVCIPTTAGTGSEVGRSSVITLNATHRKAVIFHPELMAKLVILDPELTCELPPGLTAATGADALTHCIESFTCPVFHPLCDGIALEGVRLIVRALPRAFEQPDDLEARGRMLVAAAMGAIAFQKDLGATHSLAHPLSSVCGVHHGLANALCLPAVMRFNAERKPGLYRRIGTACGLEVLKLPPAEADAATVQFISEFLAKLHLGSKLRAHGVREEQLEELTAQAWEDPCHRTNAVPVTREDLRNLYEEVL